MGFTTRRASPTPLRLISGPTPPRAYIRHTMPSMPRPTFYPSSVPRDSSHSSRSRSPSTSSMQNSTSSSYVELPLFEPSGYALGSMDSLSTRSSSDEGRAGKRIRGPWDHSRSSSFSSGVGVNLAPLKPVAVSLVGGMLV